MVNPTPRHRTNRGEIIADYCDYNSERELFHHAT